MGLIKNQLERQLHAEIRNSRVLLNGQVLKELNLKGISVKDSEVEFNRTHLLCKIKDENFVFTWSKGGQWKLQDYKGILLDYGIEKPYFYREIKSQVVGILGLPDGTNLLACSVGDKRDVLVAKYRTDEHVWYDIDLESPLPENLGHQEDNATVATLARKNSSTPHMPRLYSPFNVTIKSITPRPKERVIE